MTHPMPWAIVAYPGVREAGDTVSEGVPADGYVCHRYVTEGAAKTLREDIKPYWPGARLEVEYRP